MNANLNKHIYDGMKEDVVCKNLENLFSRKISKNKTTLIRRFVILKYKDGNNMVEHIGFYKGIVNKLVSMKMNIDDKMQISLLLSSLPDSWRTLMVTVSNSSPNGVLTMRSVKNNLLNKESRGKEKGEFSSGVFFHEKQERLEKP